MEERSVARVRVGVVENAEERVQMGTDCDSGVVIKMKGGADTRKNEGGADVRKNEWSGGKTPKRRAKSPKRKKGVKVEEVVE